MLAERIALLPRLFDISLIDYERPSDGILFASGAGLGLAIMDMCPSLRWFRDIDDYRHRLVDWEAVAIVIASQRPRLVVTAGWFSIDKPEALLRLQRGLVGVDFLNYVGGQDSLAELLEEISRKKTPIE